MQIGYKYPLLLTVLAFAAWCNPWQAEPHWHGLEVLILVLGILLTGIPHGAMDHYIARQQAMNAGRVFHIGRFIGVYIFWALLYSLLWWISPGLSLLVFLLLSAWHFGETDLKFVNIPGHLPGFKTMAYGICLLAWLLLNHAGELAAWIQILVPNCPSAPQFINGALHIPLVAFFVLLSALLAPIGSKAGSRWLVWLCFSGFLFLCGKLSLLSGFALYFTGWHSVRAFVDISIFLPAQRKWSAIWRHSLPLSIISYTFLLLIYFLTAAEVWQNSGLPAIFILLSILTLPHAHLMHELYSRVETA